MTVKLVDVYRNLKQELSKRQFPLVIDENLAMVMDLSRSELLFEKKRLFAGRGTVELNKFLEMFYTLSPKELKTAFEVDSKELASLLSQTIPCVGCRRSVERLHCQLSQSGHPALDPIEIDSNGVLSITKRFLQWPYLICNLLHGHSAKLNQLVESQLRSKKSRRCILHSLDSQRIRTPWKEVWDTMTTPCKEEVVLIDAGSLMLTLETYLHKHRFCGECRNKVLRAYWLLVEEPEPNREKGYVSGLYAGIKRCLPDKHIHLPTNTDYISALIARIQPDLLGSGGERHAKTLEIAQGEVITCLGMCVYERLHRVQLRLKEEETTCKVFAAVAVDAIGRKFQMTVENKLGISKLELLYVELQKEELAKQHRREQKKLKRKKRKEKKATENKLADEIDDEDDVDSTPCQRSSCSEEPQAVTDDASVELDLLNRSQDETFCKNCGEENKTSTPSNISNLVSNLSPHDECLSSDSENIDPCAPSPNSKICQMCSTSQREFENRECLCDPSQDCGYASGHNNPSLSCSPDGSEVACDDLCHDEDVLHSAPIQIADSKSKLKPSPGPKRDGQLKLSLQEMLEECSSSDEDDYIPEEDIKKFQTRYQKDIMQMRQELRQNLKMKFDKLCIARKPLADSTS